MNILLWILQVLLAVHTVVGAIWKFSNPAASLPSMAIMPQALWLSLSFFEIICAVALLIPAVKKKFGKYAATAAVGIALEMFLYTGFHLASGSDDHGQIVYWMVVAAICIFIAYGRTKIKPIG